MTGPTPVDTEAFLGVDGGGTKTAFRLVRGDGRLVAQHDAGSSYYFGGDIARVQQVMSEGIDAVCDQAGISPADITRAFFGIPGYGEASADVAQLARMPATILGHDRYDCDNDMVCAWAGSLGGADGVNVIAGTGSMAYGRRADLAARVGGWGEIFGDEGSAYWLGNEALRLFTQMSDGRCDPGPLLDVLRRTLDLRTDLDAIDVVLNRWKADRTRIAGLAPQVDVAAELGDTRAGDLLRSAGEQLAAQVAVVRRRLDWPADTALPVSWSGGVFNSPRVRDTFRVALAQVSSSFELRHPLLPPVLGAAVHAARTNGTPLTADAIARLHDSMAVTH